MRVLSRLFRRCSSKASRAQRSRPPGLLRRSRAARRQTRFDARSPRCAAPNGSSTPSGPSPGPRPFSPISRATPTASPSPTRASSSSTSGRHLQMEGLSHQRPRPAQDHDARRRRVHPPLSHSTCCRADSTASAITACSPAPFAPKTSSARVSCSPSPKPPATLPPRGRERGRKSRASASMPMLRRPHDHHRNLRRRAPCAFAIAKPDQDRHLMTPRLSRLAMPIFFASGRAPQPAGAVFP